MGNSHNFGTFTIFEAHSCDFARKCVLILQKKFNVESDVKFDEESKHELRIGVSCKGAKKKNDVEKYLVHQ